MEAALLYQGAGDRAACAVPEQPRQYSRTGGEGCSVRNPLPTPPNPEWGARLGHPIDPNFHGGSQVPTPLDPTLAPVDCCKANDKMTYALEVAAVNGLSDLPDLPEQHSEDAWWASLDFFGSDVFPRAIVPGPKTTVMGPGCGSYPTRSRYA